jgi:hypothetical protein
MAHFAEIDDNNIVLRVLVTDNNDPNGDEGYQWLLDNVGGTWIKTSYNGKIRKNYAGVGYSYDEELDSFVAPQPYPSWKLDKRNSQWKAPVAYPTDGFTYSWNEESLSWELMDFSEPEA